MIGRGEATTAPTRPGHRCTRGSPWSGQPAPRWGAATIREVGDWGLREVGWRDLELVEHWKRYLDEPMRYLRHVL